MVRSRDQTPSPPRHRRWGRASRTSPPASPPPPSPPSPAASSESSSPERNEHVQAAVQQHILPLNDNLLNLMMNPMARNALMQEHEEIGEEIAHILAETQNTRDLQLTISQNTDRLSDIIRRTSEMNYQLLLSLLPHVQGNNAHGHGLTKESESTGFGNNQAAMNTGGTNPENTRRSITCSVCNSRGACMLLLPCRHICACKSCEVILTHCPICDSTKANAVEVGFI